MSGLETRWLTLTAARAQSVTTKPTVPDAPPASDPDATPVTLAGDFAELRRENIVRLGKLKQPDLDRTARHQDYGEVTLVQLLHHGQPLRWR